MSIGLYQTRSGDVIHPRNCENLGLGTRLVNFVSGRPGPWCMAMAYANSPVEFGHDHIGSQ